MMEVYVDNYITMAIAQSRKDINHIANATLHEMLIVFPVSKIRSEDPISVGKCPV